MPCSRNGVLIVCCVIALQVFTLLKWPPFQNMLLKCPPLQHDVMLKCPPVQHKENNDTFLFIGVISTSKNYANRAAIRMTWAASHPSIKVMFIVARPQNASLLPQLRNESAYYKDLVLLYDVYEHYRNITYQTMEIFKIAYIMRGVSYIMKTDEDCYVHARALLSFLKHQPRTRFYAGHGMNEGRFIRDPRQKVYVSFQTSNITRTPRFGWGVGYIVSSDIGVLLAHAPHQAVPHSLINLEDMNTGILVDFVAKEHGWKIAYVRDKRFNPWACSDTNFVSHAWNKSLTPTLMLCMHANGDRCCE